nr:hypothetical protein [Streptomyces sp. CB02980]
MAQHWEGVTVPAVGAYIHSGLLVPHRKRSGRALLSGEEEGNAEHRRVRVSGECAFAHMKHYKILRGCRQRDTGLEPGRRSGRPSSTSGAPTRTRSTRPEWIERLDKALIAAGVRHRGEPFASVGTATPKPTPPQTARRPSSATGRCRWALMSNMPCPVPSRTKPSSGTRCCLVWRTCRAQRRACSCDWRGVRKVSNGSV